MRRIAFALPGLALLFIFYCRLEKLLDDALAAAVILLCLLAFVAGFLGGSHGSR